MIQLSLTYLQFVGAIAIAIGSLQIFVVLLRVIMSSKLVLQWHTKREQAKQKFIQRTQREILYEKLQVLGGFMDWLDKSLANNHSKKQFYNDFACSKQSREYWVNYLLKQYAPNQEVKVVKEAPKQEKPEIDKVKEALGGK